MKKIYTFFALLLLCAVTAVAQTYTVTYSASTGSYTATNSNGTWASAWKSAASDPFVTLTVGANNIQVSTGALFSGGNGCTYTLSAQGGYLITGYTIVGTANANGDGQTLTPAAGGSAVTFNSDQSYTLSVTGISQSSTSFTHSAPNKGIAITSFTITLEAIKPTSTYTFETSGRGTWYDDGELGCGGSTVGEYAFVPYKGKNYLYSVSSKKFMCHQMASGVTSNNNRVQMKDTDLALLIDGFTFSTTNNSNYPTAISDTKGYMFNIGGSGDMVVNTWTSFDAGNQLQVKEANTSFDNSEATALLDAYFDISITYVYKFNDTEVGRETLPATVGEAFPTPTYSAPYGFTFEAPTGTFTEADDDTEKDIALTWTLFDYADSFDNISQWYNVRMHSSQTHYLYNNNGAPAFTGTVGNNDYLWGFVGDPLNGFQVYSYTAGGAVAIDNAEPSTLSANGTSVNFKVTNGNTGTQGSTADFTFAMYATAGSYLNYQNGNIARWSSNDEGSTFMLNAATISTVEEEYEQLLALLETYPFGTGVNQYKVVVEQQDYTSQMATIIEGLKTQGYSEANMANAQALFNGMSLNMPQTGFYRFKGNSTGKYIGAASSGKQPMVEGADNAGIYYYDADTKFLMNYPSGQYLSAAIGNAFVAAGGNGVAFNFYETGYSTPTYGTYRIRVANNSNGSLIDWTDGYLNGWGDGNHERCEWTLEEVTELPITLHSVDGTNYFATFSAPVAVRIEGATLNNVTPKANSISYKAADTNLLPANTGVLLTGESGSATAYVVTDEVADAGYGLQAYDAAFTVSDNTMLFLGKGKDSGKVGFYALGSTKTNGFKAYFANSSGEAKEGFDLVDANETTGVESIDNSQFAIDNAPVYNLQGQRVVKAQKGVFIQNGKKIIVK